MSAGSRQNAHLTHKANIGVGRHGWLRLTPAYSVNLVRDYAQHLPAQSIVTDPFSGTGTTPLAAAEYGHFGQSLDINPFLVWLGSVKTDSYSPDTIKATVAVIPKIVKMARQSLASADGLWQPDLHNIERWWDKSHLDALKCIRDIVDRLELPQTGKNLLDIAFCRILISSSNAAFNHQSMSFKEEDDAPRLFDIDSAELTLLGFAKEAESIVTSASEDLAGSAKVMSGDSRDMNPSDGQLIPCDLLLTSPPYVNRMSYIRELRPYMYWLKRLDQAKDAGELDWKAIGGTWGIATSRVAAWEMPTEVIPISEEMQKIQTAIRDDGGKNGPLLSNYVAKYFVDMWQHFQAAFKVVKSGGYATYIVGNSTFYGHVVPAEQWYEKLMTSVGFEQLKVEVIRKRNSNKALYEYCVSGRRP